LFGWICKSGEQCNDDKSRNSPFPRGEPSSVRRNSQFDELSLAPRIKFNKY
jgi:hypothetical protein